MDCPKCQLQCVPTCNDGDNRWWCSRCHAGYPASQPDPNRPCDTHGISGCERCFGWCDPGAPDPKDALTTARLEEALALTRALVAERDQLRARVQELTAECEKQEKLGEDWSVQSCVNKARADRLAAELDVAKGQLDDEKQHHEYWKDKAIFADADCERMEAERDAARAECEALKKNLADAQSDCAAEVEACRRLEAQAARMREALECIETGHDPSTGEPNASAAIAKQALAETDAGAWPSERR